jgi:hypothetical protein
MDVFRACGISESQQYPAFPTIELIYLSAFSNLMDVLHIPLHMIVGSNVKDMYLYSFPIPTPTSLSLQEFSSWIRSDFISDQRLRNI